AGEAVEAAPGELRPRIGSRPRHRHAVAPRWGLARNLLRPDQPPLPPRGPVAPARPRLGAPQAAPPPRPASPGSDLRRGAPAGAHGRQEARRVAAPLAWLRWQAEALAVARRLEPRGMLPRAVARLPGDDRQPPQPAVWLQERRPAGGKGAQLRLRRPQPPVLAAQPGPGPGPQRPPPARPPPRPWPLAARTPTAPPPPPHPWALHGPRAEPPVRGAHALAPSLGPPARAHQVAPRREVPVGQHPRHGRRRHGDPRQLAHPPRWSRARGLVSEMAAPD